MTFLVSFDKLLITVIEMKYMNDFMFFVIKPLEGTSHIYCSGVNITRFAALTKGRHRLGQNPVEKGLQSLNNDIRALVISNNSTPETKKILSCREFIPLKNELWYAESFLIHNYTNTLGEKIMQTAPFELLRKMFKAMLLNESVPENLNPLELQNYLQNIIEKLQ